MPGSEYFVSYQSGDPGKTEAWAGRKRTRSNHYYSEEMEQLRWILNTENGNHLGGHLISHSIAIRIQEHLVTATLVLSGDLVLLVHLSDLGINRLTQIF